MSDDCPDRNYQQSYVDNSDIVIAKLKRQARHYRVVESRYNAKESILGDPCLDIEWHTAPLPKQCYCPVEPCICTSHLLKQGNLPNSIPMDTYRKATKEPDGTLIPRLAAAVEAEVEICKQLAQCGHLKDRGPEFCTSHCPAFLTPVKESGFYAQKRKLIEKYIKDNKLEKKMQRLLNLKTDTIQMAPKPEAKKTEKKIKAENFPEIIVPKTVVLPRPAARRKKMTEKEEVEELEGILGIETHKETEPETMLRSASQTSTKERPGSSRTSATTGKREEEPGRRPSCDSESVQHTESELNRAYNKIRTFKLKHLCEEDPLPSFLPSQRMVELKPRPKSNRKQVCEPDDEEIARREKERACEEEDTKRSFKPEAKQVSSLYECKSFIRASQPELLSEPKKLLQDEPKRISEPELRRIYEPRRMSLDDPRLTTENQLGQMPEPKREPENESSVTAEPRITSDLDTERLMDLKSEVNSKHSPCKTIPTTGQDPELKKTADDESKQTEAINASKIEGTKEQESKCAAERKLTPKNESKRSFGYRRTAKKEPKPVCELKHSSEFNSAGVSAPEPRKTEFKKLFETRRHNSKTKQKLAEDGRKQALEVKRTIEDKSKRHPDSRDKSVAESERAKAHRRTAKDASKYTSKGEPKKITDVRRMPELGSRQTSELGQPCGSIAIANLASAHPSRTSALSRRTSAGSHHSKASVKSDRSSCDEHDNEREKRGDSARSASAASSASARDKQLNNPCPCFEDGTDKSAGRRPPQDVNCVCKDKECMAENAEDGENDEGEREGRRSFGEEKGRSGDKGPIGRMCHSVI